MNNKAIRQSNIELLRIIAIIGVVILHLNLEGAGGGFKYVTHGSANYYVLYTLESLFICAVNLFVLITGYFLAYSYKRTIRKPVELIVQVIVLQETYYIISTVILSEAISINSLISKLLPANFFVIFYCVIFIVSPYINRTLDTLDYKSSTRLVMILFFFISIYPTLVIMLGNIKGEEIVGIDSIGMYGSQKGYTIVNFFMMYVIGAHIRKNGIVERINNGRGPLFGILICVIVITTWAVLEDKHGNLLCVTAWTYCNPLVVLEAIMILLFFLQRNIGTKRIVNKIAKSSLTVFLTHGWFIKYVNMQNLVDKNVVIMTALYFITAIVIFFTGAIIHFIYSCLTKNAFDRMFRKQITIVNLEKTDES